MDVLNNSHDLPRLEQFSDYITETWVDDDARFQLVLRNQWVNVGPRTNNNLEGFHNKPKNRIQKDETPDRGRIAQEKTDI